MTDRDQRRYDRLSKVQTFGRINVADFAPNAKALTHFTNIDNIIADINRAKAGQTPARVSKETLLDALTPDLQKIARTARAIELKESGFAAPYRIPDNASETAVTTHADAVLLLLEDQTNDSAATRSAKAALRGKFINYELSTDFVAELRAACQAVTDANQHNQDEVQEGVENTALIGQLLGRARDEVTELDAIMHNKYARQPEKLRAWQSASHVERAPQRERKTVTALPGSSTSTPAIAA